jgi:hypothetical protein
VRHKQKGSDHCVDAVSRKTWKSVIGRQFLVCVRFNLVPGLTPFTSTTTSNIPSSVFVGQPGFSKKKKKVVDLRVGMAEEITLKDFETA